MKRSFVLLTLAAIIGSLLIGCGSEEIKVYNDPSETISVGVGKNFIIALESNPTTGYSWREAFDSSLLELVESKYEQTPTATLIVGAGGTQSFEFKALKKGETEVTLVYKRPWEPDSPDQMTKVFTVNIK